MATHEENKAAGLTVFGVGDFQFKKYDELLPSNEYDHERAEKLAQAMSELAALRKRESYLLEILENNKDLKKFLWATATGEVMSLHKIDTGHLQNIINLAKVRGGRLSRALKIEAMSRGIDATETTAPRPFDEDEDMDW